MEKLSDRFGSFLGAQATPSIIEGGSWELFPPREELASGPHSAFDLPQRAATLVGERVQRPDMRPASSIRRGAGRLLTTSSIDVKAPSGRNGRSNRREQMLQKYVRASGYRERLRS